MKKIFLLLSLCFIFVGQAIAQDAPSPREIGDAYIENTGGVDAWKAIEATKVKGTAAMQGMEFPMTMTNAKGDKSYLEVDVQGQKIIQAFDGEVAWQVMPFQGITKPTEMSPEETEQAKDQKFLSEFIDTEARGFKLEAVEGKEIEGTETYGVRVTNEEGYDHTYYFDTEYMIPIMVATPIKSGPQKGAMMETYMSDYQEVENIMMPFFMEVKFNGQSIQKITFTEVTLNPEVKAEMFSMPKDN
ncbi:hypothetical protein [Lewinella sp. W8]|uniref:hypothetical protein n=1 Tax=Lewinella sp. W8 TaxID=2528208 RepID=UPI001067798A|nr:hypothetical protein [Lewinella sp. W8]MTB51856.1 hypothetical protein [Lewinella sp. W8]